ncbi:peptidoglycan-associated lipoprotein Pal [Nitrosococcus watsonii]|uniref:Peptidoglycan-associated lipoprotein n=1 Tax=Nitrosococcus watsoni (strain C-113) TaxID=105559 RepID=D8K8Q3_NITWC|nr:peptidoglycan-associated lipoprotein Pal [Nitrosococcus watsonii]ADJ27113.1 peptidoglycan-associated lipoprotein [Nitrosococcus watsonii C-113]
MRLVIPFFLLAGIYGLVGCAGGTAATQGGSPGVVVEERGESPYPEGEALEEESATTWGIGEGAAYEGDPLADPASPLASRVVYFEFDSSEIQQDDRPIVEAHGGYLAKHPDIKIILEGHTDERGSREYNLALGERRANAVRSLILLMGASEEQVEVVSYGEERPAVDGQDEGAWQLNRRVEILYPGE